MIIISIMLFMLSLTIIGAVLANFIKQIQKVKPGCFINLLVILSLELLLVSSPAIVVEQFYPDTRFADIKEFAMWKSPFLWYVLATILMFLMFFKYLFYFAVKFNLFGKAGADITILPIEWDFKGVFGFISEMISVLISIYQLITLVR